MAKTSTRKRSNFVVRYFRETVAELRKVNWPTRQEATRLTTIVLIVVGVFSILLGALDLLFSRLFAMILGF